MRPFKKSYARIDKVLYKMRWQIFGQFNFLMIIIAEDIYFEILLSHGQRMTFSVKIIAQYSIRRQFLKLDFLQYI